MTRHEPLVETTELSRYVTAAIYRWRVVLVFAVLGLLAAGAVLTVQPPRATSSATVGLNVISQDIFEGQREPSGLIDAQTEVQTARSSAVIDATAAALGDQSPAEVRDGLTAELLPEATVLRITYTAATPEAAIAGADEAAQQFLDYRSLLATNKVEATLDRLRDRRDTVRESLGGVVDVLSSAPAGSPERSQASTDRDLLNAEISALVTRINSASSIDTDGGTILSAASDSRPSVSPNAPLILVLGLVAGVLLGLAGAVLREAFARRVRDSVDVEDGGGQVALAVVAARPAADGGRHDDQDALGAAWEQLSVDLASDAPLVLLTDVACPWALVGLAADLADAVCRSEPERAVEVVWVGDADAAAHRWRDLTTAGPKRPGWSVLTSKLHPRLTVSIPRTAPSASGLRTYLDTKVRSDAVRIVAVASDSGATLVVGAARRCDGAVLVAARGRSRVAGMRDTRARLEGVQTPVLGTVIVRGRPGKVAPVEAGAGGRRPVASVEKRDAQALKR